MSNSKKLEIKDMSQEVKTPERAMVLALAYMLDPQRGVVVYPDNVPLVVWNNGDHILIIQWDSNEPPPPEGTLIKMSDNDANMLQQVYTPIKERIN